MFQKFVRDYLYFNRKERLGLLAVAAMLILSLFLPDWFPKAEMDLTATETPALSKAMDSVAASEAENNTNRYAFEPASRHYNREPDFSKASLFDFDPNTLDVAGWMRLGLREKTARTIDKYRSKGGRFYQPADLQKIWGLPPGFYERVKDHIRIDKGTTRYAAKTFVPMPREERKLSTVNINEADTSALIALPGIGSKLAARIVAFREKLGGFYSVNQVGETYGLPDSTFQSLRNRFVVGGTVRQLNVNTASKDELKAHPYIRWQLANAIVEYRNQHGRFGSLEDLKQIQLITDEWLQKAKSYLTF